MSITVMKQALEALELLAKYENPLTKIQVRKPRDGGSIVTVYPHQVATDAAEPLRERLAQPQRTHWDGCEAVHPECKQPEQEPVAHTLNCVCGAVWDISLNGAEEMVHTPDAPKPRREWVGLTDEEVKALPQWFPSHETAAVLPLIRAIEAKLKEKNT